jgi:hypothetical protein
MTKTPQFGTPSPDIGDSGNSDTITFPGPKQPLAIPTPLQRAP